MPDIRMTRRAMLARGAGATALAATASAAGSPAADEPVPLPRLDGVWDMHGHLTAPELSGTPCERIDTLLRYADRMGIERLIVFMGYPTVHDPSPDEVRRQNDQVLAALEHAPDRAFGFVYLNPKQTEASLAELDRCVANGPMVGIKLWVALHCHHEQLDPIVERAIELKAPVLQHTFVKVTGNLPAESTPAHLAQLASRHPRASFIAAHVGGQWEWGVRAIRATPNVTAEICGSDPAAGMVEMAVRELGAGRVMYGSDFGGRSFASQLAKVFGAHIPASAKRLILRDNIRRMLRPILATKGLNS